MNVQITWLDFQAILPELILVGFALFGLLYGAFFRRSSDYILPYVFIVGLSAALVTTYMLPDERMFAFYKMVVADKISMILSVVFILTALLTILLSLSYNENVKLEFTEYYPLLILSTIGMMLMAKANHFIIFFLGLETMSIALYVLAGFRKFNKFSLESSLKYFLLGAFATGILLYGFALMYGEIGSTYLHDIKTYFQTHGLDLPVILYLSLGLIIVGFGFKVALVPFHMWTPDVYQGAPIPVTAFMAIGAKAAGFAAIIRIFLDATFHISIEWSGVFWILAVLTMIVGNISALVQDNIKRMLAYSSIAHAGYILIAVVSADEAHSIYNILFYLFVYGIMNIAAFAVVDLVSGEKEKYVDINHFAGLGFKNPLLGFAFTIALVSLAGLPPTAGFMGKLYIFSTAVNNGHITLVIIGVLNSLVSVYYYLRPVVYMYMKEENKDVAIKTVYPAAGLALLITIWGILHLGIFPGFFNVLF
ncbi:MAG: NADH-quinone oxidoreductase subunit N [Calditrichia bacterium]